MKITHYSNGTKRQVTAEETKAVSHFFQALYSCDFGNVPFITLAHNFIQVSNSTKPFYKCFSYAKTAMQCSRPLVPVCIDGHNDCFHNLTLARYCAKERPRTGNCSLEKNTHLKPFFEYYDCLRGLEPHVKQCLPILNATCKKAKIHAAKVHRLTMETLDTLIKEMPDVHVIFYTRDPRGILNSRARTGKKPYFFLYPLVGGNLAKAAEYFCPKMMRDLEIANVYRTRYPGAIMTLAYEDLAACPSENLQKVYSFIGHEVPDTVKAWLLQATGARMLRGKYATTRKNSTETSLKWKELLNTTTLEVIDNACSDIYRELGRGD